MAITGSGPLFFSGRLIACHVYMLLCADGDDIHIKIGLSQHPGKRALALYHNSPLPIECMAAVDMPSREMARKLERGLHTAFAEWRTNGEWFKFALADKPEFNQIQQGVLAPFQSPSRKLRWAKVNVKQLVADALARRNYMQRKWRTSGRAYRDAVSSGFNR